MLSYHADADISTDPYELGLDRLVNVDMDAEFIGKSALRKIRDTGVIRKQVGLIIDCPPFKSPNTTFWAITKNGETVGKVTSAVYSPRLQKNIALALVSKDYAEIKTALEIQTSAGSVAAEVVERPFYDPKKKIASTPPTPCPIVSKSTPFKAP